MAKNKMPWNSNKSLCWNVFIELHNIDLIYKIKELQNITKHILMKITLN